MNRKRFYIWACLACFVPATLWADETIFSASSRQNPMDNLGGGVRAAAMGSAFVAVSDDASAINWNPAGLSNLRQSELSMQHSSLFGTGRETLFYGLPIPQVGGVGLSGGYMGYGSFDGRDSLGTSTGNYTANQIDLGAAWGGRVAGVLSLGAQIHGVQQTLAEKSYSLFTAGFGALVKTSGDWHLGASYMNGGISKSSIASASAFRVGLAKNWKFKKGWGVLTSASGNISPQSGNSFQGGLEADYGGKYFLRVGYDYRVQKSGFDGLYGPSAGLGLSLGPMRLDYAYVPYGDMGSSHQFGLAYHFGAVYPELIDRKPKAVLTQPLTVSPAPVTVYVQVPVTMATQPTSTSSVPQAVTGSSGGGELVMTFEEAPEGLATARFLAKEGRSAEAVKAYVDWIGKNSRDAQAWWELGSLYYRLGKKEYALKCFESILTLQPYNKKLSDWLEQNRGR